MIKGIGTDLVAIKRIEDIFTRHGRRFAEKILGDHELAEFAAAANEVNFLAKRFAAKEAVTKAFGLGLSKGMRWQDIQLDHHPGGQPIIKLSGHAKQYSETIQATTVHISLSDDNDMVCAFVVIE
jgi:holo-[acyl-carrier protein] synthase